ncbi:MAG: alpha/beta fold hydrolase [Pseudomonadota bacterium]
MNIPTHLYPWTGQRLDLGGLSLHYLDEGAGPPVLCVHGNPTWSFYYRALVRELSADHRVIVPDHIGCGLSDKPGDEAYEYTLARRIADLGALVDHLGVTEGLTLVVHDWGGAIGLGMAEVRPGLVKRLVVLNTGAFPLPPAKSLPFLLWLARDTGVGSLLVRRLNAFSRGAAMLCTTRHKLAPEVKQGLTAPYEPPENRLATLRFVQDIPLGPEHRAWASVKAVEASLPRYREIPVLLCWGMKDFVFDHHFLDRFVEEWPAAEVLRLEDAGHYVLEDAPEEVVPRIRAFLDAHPLEKAP